MQRSDWAADNLIEFSEEALNRYPSKARAFLRSFGMPRGVEIDDITRITLEPMCHPLEAVTDDDWDDLANQLVIGEVEIDGGASLLCVVDCEQETVGFLDPDDGDSLIFVNSDLGAFAQSLLKVSQVNRTIAEDEEAAAHDIDQLALDLRKIDPAAFDNERCYWRAELEYRQERTS